MCMRTGRGGQTRGGQTTRHCGRAPKTKGRSGRGVNVKNARCAWASFIGAAGRNGYETLGGQVVRPVCSVGLLKRGCSQRSQEGRAGRSWMGGDEGGGCGCWWAQLLRAGAPATKGRRFVRSESISFRDLQGIRGDGGGVGWGSVGRRGNRRGRAACPLRGWVNGWRAVDVGASGRGAVLVWRAGVGRPPAKRAAARGLRRCTACWRPGTWPAAAAAPRARP